MALSPTPRHARTASGDRSEAAPPRRDAVAAASLITAASAVFLWPTVSPLSLLLAPIAWALGHEARRRAEDAGDAKQLVGETGRRLGKFLTFVVIAVVALPIVVLVIVLLGSWLM